VIPPRLIGIAGVPCEINVESWHLVKSDYDVERFTFQYRKYLSDKADAPSVVGKSFRRNHAHTQAARHGPFPFHRKKCDVVAALAASLSDFEAVALQSAMREVLEDGEGKAQRGFPLGPAASLCLLYPRLVNSQGDSYNA